MSVALDAPTVDELVADIAPDALLGVPADYSGIPMTATKALIRRLKHQGGAALRLYCLPFSTIQADLLIGAGLVGEVEAAAITLGEFGLAPCFSRAVEGRHIAMKDSTCPALHAQLQATEKGVSFMPLRGLIGSDILAHRPDWRVIDDPFDKNGSQVVALPAVKLDVALFHAAAADRNGNVWIGRRRELATMAHASARVLVTVEEIRDVDFYDDEATAAGILPALYVDQVAVAKRGAAPGPLFATYEADPVGMKAYATAAQTQAGFDAFLSEHVLDMEPV